LEVLINILEKLTCNYRSFYAYPEDETVELLKINTSQAKALFDVFILHLHA